MNRLLQTASKSAASSLRINQATTSSSAVRFLTVRQFSDSTAAAGDGEITVGTVKYFSFKNQYGFIIPDGVDKRDHSSSDLAFIHRNDIMKADSEEKFFPGLSKGQRVQFKVGKADAGKESMRGETRTNKTRSFLQIIVSSDSGHSYFIYCHDNNITLLTPKLSYFPSTLKSI